MRKSVLLIAGFLVTFGVFAKGPMTASAPSGAAMSGYLAESALRVSSEGKRPAAERNRVPVARPVLEAAAGPHTLSIERIDLAAELALVPAAEEFRGAFDEDGWATIAFGDSSLSTSLSGARVAGQHLDLTGSTVLARSERRMPVRDIIRTRSSERPTEIFAAPAVSTRAVEKAATFGAAPGAKHGRSALRASGGGHRLLLPDLKFVAEAAHQEQISRDPGSRALSSSALEAYAQNITFHVASPSHAAAALGSDRRSPSPALEAAMKDQPVFLVNDHTDGLGLVQRPAKLAVGSADVDRGLFFGSDTSHSGRLPDLFREPVRLAAGNMVSVSNPVTLSAAGTVRILPLLPGRSESLNHFVPGSNAGIGRIRPEAPVLDAPLAARIAPLAPALAETAHAEVPAWLSVYASRPPEKSMAAEDIRPRLPKPLIKQPVAVVTGLRTLNVAPLKRADGNYCDPNFIGEPIRFSQTAELTLEDLLLQIHNRFGINFLMGPTVGRLPINIKAGAIPWNVLLRSQLFVSGVRARCLGPDTIELIENKTLPSLQDSADVTTRFVKLKFLQKTGSGTVDLAGRQGGQGAGGQGGGCGGSTSGGAGGSGSGGGSQGGQTGETAAQQASSKFDKLVIEIEKILGIRSMTESTVSGGGQSVSAQVTEERRTNRSVTQIPGRNILVIRATEEEHALIDEIIARADRPPFQVVIKGLVYTANQDRLRDIGVQTTITGGTADGRSTSGVFGHTIGGGGTLFDFSTIIGTFDFNVQATALQENGVLSVKSRPFSTVLDGLCTRLNVGRSIPIVIDSTLGGQGALEFVAALNKLEVTPHVIDDENGNPIAVTLELVMFANEVDTSVTTRGVPAVNERSIQTQLLLSEDKTAILGGFTLDSDQKSISKTPGLGDIPLLGELFKRRVSSSLVNRLYFAISVSVIPYGEAIMPVPVPGATTDPPSITPEMKRRSDKAEPKQVTSPVPDNR